MWFFILRWVFNSGAFVVICGGEGVVLSIGSLRGGCFGSILSRVGRVVGRVNLGVSNGVLAGSGGSIGVSCVSRERVCALSVTSVASNVAKRCGRVDS